jgi:hypothetical protein
MVRGRDGEQQPGEAGRQHDRQPIWRGGKMTDPAAAPPMKIKNYLVESILVTICCCLPLGIVAIVFAAQVNGKLQAGDIAGAQEAADKAKKFCLIGLILGIVINAIVVLLQVMGVLAAGGASQMPPM